MTNQNWRSRPDAGQPSAPTRLLLVMLAAATLLVCAACDSGSSGSGEADVVSDAAAQETQADLLVGAWTRQQGDIAVELTFHSDGTYSQVTTTNIGGPSESTGTWQAANGRLRLATQTRSEESDLHVDATRMARTQVYVRQSLGDGLVGTWKSVDVDSILGAEAPELDRQKTDTLAIFDDGTAEYSSHTVNDQGQQLGDALQIDNRPATWAVEADRVTLTFPSTGDIREFEQIGDVLVNTSPLYVHNRK